MIGSFLNIPRFRRSGFTIKRVKMLCLTQIPKQRKELFKDTRILETNAVLFISFNIYCEKKYRTFPRLILILKHWTGNGVISLARNCVSPSRLIQQNGTDKETLVWLGRKYVHTVSFLQWFSWWFLFSQILVML